MILVNPHSFRMTSRNRLQRIDQLAHTHGLPLYAVHGPDEIAAALADGAPGPDDRLIIIGGDGTLQAAISRLAGRAQNGLAPTLCMLGGGRTNFTARDLGSHNRLLQSLEHLLAQASWKSTQRRVLRINSSKHGALYGFFIAGALVDAIIRDCHNYRARSRGWLRTGHAATPWRLAQLAALGLTGRTGFVLPDLQISADRLGVMSGRTRILLVSSLQHDSGSLDPYADRGKGEVRLTAIHGQASAFWRRLPALLSGRFRPEQTTATGYLSGRTGRLQITGLPSICLDGQEYALDATQTLDIQPGPAFRFLQP